MRLTTPDLAKRHAEGMVAVSALTIWADDDPPPENSGPVALWQAFLPEDAPEDWYAMPEEVHRNREGLRTDYLAWLHEVGVAKVRSVPLVNRMAIRPGLSYWWMTIPADNSIESNSPAYIAVRLMALAALADRLDVTNVKIVTSDRSLARLLRAWAKATGRTYEVLLGPRPRLTRESLYLALPILAALRVIIGHAGIPRRVKRRPDEPASGLGQTGICLVDYLAHFSPGAVEEGRFASNYWGPLVEVLDEPDEPVRWLHLSADLASKGVVTRDDHLVGRFDEHAAKQTHDLLHRHLTWAVLARSCRDYLRVRWFGLTARPRARLFADASSGTSMWQAFRAAYRDQFFGKTAMLNCLWLNLFEEACERMPPQRLGIYLFENQPWELAFIHAWRGAGHGELIGVAHTTTRFWDTRYFKDPRDLWSESGANPMPWPDRVAVNGDRMREMCERGFYVPERMVNVASLRFSIAMKPTGRRLGMGVLRVLLCGEYSESASLRLQAMVLAAVLKVPTAVSVTYRPHPTRSAQEVAAWSYTPSRTLQALRPQLLEADIAICGPHSTIALEAVLNGTAVIVVADGHAFLSSPAEEDSRVTLVTTGAELCQALTHPAPFANPDDLSHRGVASDDASLSSWRHHILSGVFNT